MKIRQLTQIMENKIRALILGVTFSVAATGASHAMSELVSLSQQPLWPVSSTPAGTLMYSVTTVGRSGSGLLEVALSAGNLPAGVTVTFSPSTLRFTGNQLTAQVATMTVSCPCPVALDCVPFTLTGAAARETLTITNLVSLAPEYIASRPATLYIDNLTSGNLCVRGLGATGKTYQIEVSSDLSKSVWTPLGSATADGNGRFTFFTQNSGSSAHFYRAVTTSDPFVCP